MTFCPVCGTYKFYGKTCPNGCGRMKEKERLAKPFRHYNPNFPRSLTDEPAGGD